LTPFDFQLPTRIVFGPGKVAELGAIARSLGEFRRALVVSDPGVVAAGHTRRGVESLEAAGLQTRLFSDFRENPTTAHVEAGLVAAREFRPELIVGFGGGSSMDCAKGINFLYSCGGRMQDYWGKDKATGPLAPMIAVPTTAGTGSETQSYALISDAESHAKMACGDKRAAFRAAVLDPELTLTQPPRVTALAGFDALSHAVETFVTRPRTTLSIAFSREAWRLLAGNFERVLREPQNLAAREAMQLGACFAGLAIENSMLGAAHAAANPLTAAYGVAHGDAIALALPHVVRRNGDVARAQYRELLLLVGLPTAEATAAEDLAQFLSRISREAGLAQRLGEVGVERSRLSELAADAARQWTGTFNPVSLDQSDFMTIYDAAF
jgi:alcohol dehydrogenase